ncbi:MAG: hypothetical protein Rhob2KO_50990 [Rhodopirellula baltica]
MAIQRKSATSKRVSKAPSSPDTQAPVPAHQRVCKECRHAMETVFEESEVELRLPFASLPIGKAMQAAKRAAEK